MFYLHFESLKYELLGSPLELSLRLELMFWPWQEIFSKNIKCRQNVKWLTNSRFGRGSKSEKRPSRASKIRDVPVLVEARKFKTIKIRAKREFEVAPIRVFYQ